MELEPNRRNRFDEEPVNSFRTSKSRQHAVAQGQDALPQKHSRSTSLTLVCNWQFAVQMLFVISGQLRSANAIKYDWQGALKDFNDLGGKQRQTFKGGDAAKVKTFLQNRVRPQKTKDFLKYAGGRRCGLTGARGFYELYRNLSPSNDGSR